MFDGEKEEFPGQCTAGVPDCRREQHENWERSESSGAEFFRDKRHWLVKEFHFMGDRKFTVVYTAARFLTGNYFPLSTSDRL